MLSSAPRSPQRLLILAAREAGLWRVPGGLSLLLRLAPTCRALSRLGESFWRRAVLGHLCWDERTRVRFGRTWHETACILVCGSRRPGAAACRAVVDGGTLERAALGLLERGQLSRLSAVSCRDLSPADFDARFGAARKPVLLRGACATRWTFAELRTRFAERKWHINDWERGGCDVRLSLGSFEEYVRRLADKDAEPLYLFDSSPPAALLDCLSRPSVLGDNFLEEGPAEPRGEGGEGEEGEEGGEDEVDEVDDILGEARWLLVGPPRSGTRWHFDPHSVSGWNCCLEGRKLWFFWPPTASDGWGTGWGGGRAAPAELPPGLAASLGAHAWLDRFLLPRLAGGGGSGLERLRWCVQEPGQVVYVPHGWWHLVINLTESVAFQGWIVSRHNAQASAAACADYAPRFAAWIRAKLRAQAQMEGEGG